MTWRLLKTLEAVTGYTFPYVESPSVFLFIIIFVTAFGESWLIPPMQRFREPC